MADKQLAAPRQDATMADFFARRVTHTTQVTLFYPVEIYKGISTENISLPILHVHHHHLDILPLIITSTF
jgi:hypothetical protein